MKHPKPEADDFTSESALPELADILDKRWHLTQDHSRAAAAELHQFDQQIRDRFERTVAPLVLDIAGFTRLTAKRGVIHYLTLIQRMAKICDPIVMEYGGTLTKHSADNLFAHFPTVTHAIDAAWQMHTVLDRENFKAPSDFDIYISIGIGYGPTLVFEHDMWGQELILASKLGEDIAASREILLTEAAQATLPDNMHKVSHFPVILGGDSYMAYRLESIT